MRRKRTALLEVNHSLHQRLYVDWKYGILRNLVGTPPKQRRNNGARVAYRFTTLSVSEFVPIHEMFYHQGKKIVPLLEIDATAMGVWFMDDGSRSRSSVYFNTQQFTLDDQLRLIQMLKDQWKIVSSLNKDKGYYRIRVARSSIATLRKTIERILLPCFAYKLPPERESAR